MRKHLLYLLLILPSLFSTAAAESPQSPVIVAYVTSWSTIMPDPWVMTHLNYAFGHVNDTFDGVRIDNPDRLRDIIKLKDINPRLRVMLSIGGWTSGGFSEMASTAKRRRAFAEDCARVVREYNLDGIDIDWEYPGSNAAGISASSDPGNFVKLVAELRHSLGHDYLLTIASEATVTRYEPFPSPITGEPPGANTECPTSHHGSVTSTTTVAHSTTAPEFQVLSAQQGNNPKRGHVILT